MPGSDRRSLWNALGAGEDLAGRFLAGADATVALADLVGGSSLGGDARDLRGRTVLIATTEQLAAGLALIELDGIARRIILCPSDLPAEHLDFVMASIPVDAMVSDRPDLLARSNVRQRVACSSRMMPGCGDRTAQHATEWILTTSGTTGRPKMVAHTLGTLAGGIDGAGAPRKQIVWSTFYDIRRYGGLQIFLRALVTGGSMVLSSAGETATDFLARAGGNKATHISGTPTHWRRALMSRAGGRLNPEYIRLSGEIVDQSILDNLRSVFPEARIAHAFASTEAGVAFDVSDGLAGFPARLIGACGGGMELKVQGTLRIRSSRNAIGYIGQEAGAVTGADGFVDTGDLVELRGDRYYFMGRRDGVINVGGQKVHPEEVEGVINLHPQVRMSLVRRRSNPITGAVVVAEVVLDPGSTGRMGRREDVELEILQLCRGRLPRYKVPASIQLVSDLPVAATGKMVRRPCAISS